MWVWKTLDFTVSNFTVFNESAFRPFIVSAGGEEEHALLPVLGYAVYGNTHYILEF